MKLQNKTKKDHSLNSNSTSTSIQSLSPWRLLAFFVILNLILINAVNYWRPFNHDNIQQQFESKQSAIFSAYELQQSLKAFKIDPGINAFNLIQKSVAFGNSLNKYGNKYQDQAYGLNNSIEQAVAKSASLKSLAQNVDNIIRSNKNLKQKILNNLSEFKNNDLTATIIKNSLFTIDKIDSFLQNLKYINWNTADFATKAQENIEAIGLEIDQINNLIQTNNSDTDFSTTSDSLEQIFNELNVLMPDLLGLMDLNNKIVSIEQEQNNIINALKLHEIGYINNMDSRTIIIFTMVFANILLLGLILFIKLSAKTKVIYNDYKNKREIYYLSHSSNAKDAGNVATADDVDNINKVATTKVDKVNKIKKINKVKKAANTNTEVNTESSTLGAGLAE